MNTVILSVDYPTTTPLFVIALQSEIKYHGLSFIIAPS